MAEPQTPSEEQVKAANEAEMAKWEGDFKEEDLAVPYKREAEDKKVDTKTAEDTDKAGEEPKEDQPVTEPDDEPEPQTALEDPGEYKPADYSFEVTLADGKTHKVSTIEEAEKLADDPENFETPKQLMDFINKQAEMKSKLDKDFEKWQEKKTTFTEQLETETQRREQINSYVGEFKYLVGKGLLPAVPKEYVDADWSDPEVAKQPGVKEQMDILNYMVKENKVRAKAGIKPLTSIVDTFNAMQADPTLKKVEDTKAQEAAAKKAADDARKAAGARVAGVSPAQQGSFVPKGIAVGNPNVLRRGASVWDD